MANGDNAPDSEAGNERIVCANGVDLCVVAFGDRGDGVLRARDAFMKSASRAWWARLSFARENGLVQLGSDPPPIRHEAIHERPEASVVAAFQ